MFGLLSSRGATGTASIVINKPVDRVFNFIAVDFFENYPRWSPEVQELELLSTPPLQLNSLVRQVRIDQGQRSESTFKITTCKFGEKLVFEGVSNAYRCSYDFTLSDPDKEDNPIVYCNKAFELITGYSKEETVGRNCRFLHEQDKDQKELQQVRDAIKNAKPVVVTLKNFRKNGELFYNRLSITPLFDNDEHLIYFLGVQYDVTEQILAKQEIIQLTDALKVIQSQ